MSTAGTELGSAAADLDVTAVLDAIPDATAVLDSLGAITAVNHAWRMFSVDNGGQPQRTGVGVNYLDVCDRAAAAGCVDAGLVGTGLRAVLAGDTVECDLDYPCPSPAVGRWFVLRVTPISGPVSGALVTHTNISRRKIAEQELERRASEDPLTGLANRALFLERLTSALTPRTGRHGTADVGLLYLDLDGFKPVNDTYGHAAGDEVLQVISDRLRRLTRAQDTLGRLGGDEFALLAPRITSDGLAGLVSRIRKALALPLLVHGEAVRVGVSVGSYLATPGEDAVHCLNQADRAMYEVKKSRQRRHASGAVERR